MTDTLWIDQERITNLQNAAASAQQHDNAEESTHAYNQRVFSQPIKQPKAQA